MSSTTDEPETTVARNTDAATGWLARTWRTYVTDVRRDTNTAALEAIGTGDRRASDETIGTLLLLGALCLIGIEYFGRTFEPQWLQSALRAVGLDAAAAQVGESILDTPHGKFWGLSLWSAVRVFFSVAVPLLIARRFLHLSPGDLGMRLRGIRSHVWPYVFLYFAAMPVIVWASFGAEFESRYPFYDPLPGEGLWPYVIGWWVLYSVQFVAVEVFFRGFLVLGLAPRMGIMAVYVSMVPYVMIHFNKPLAETLGAIVTALALGHLALKYRSIWWGAALHIAAALSFDLLALQHEGFF
ncbi:MAG TPA: CPBP family intramembrane glutamic endopeptidase [Acidimicrobiales bacterium]|nr:CPBP family intramembrane glutamic endopeptidase [Acidimicrobiales bacterium]